MVTGSYWVGGSSKVGSKTKKLSICYGGMMIMTKAKKKTTIPPGSYMSNILKISKKIL